MTMLAAASILGLSMLAGPLDPEHRVILAPDESPGVTSYTVRGETHFSSGSARVTTKLPAGYPRPTAPGHIEIKSYPEVRRAVVRSTSDLDGRSRRQTSGAFFPLFRHIQRNDIAMTAPVEMDYDTLGEEDVGTWSMAFLYDIQERGPTGTDGIVVIEDAPPMMVISMGAQGLYVLENYRRTLTQLEEALASVEGVEASGPARVLNYNGPSRRPADSWYEVQIPIQVSPTAETGTEDVAREDEKHPIANEKQTPETGAKELN